MENIVQSIARKAPVNWWEHEIQKQGLAPWVEDVVISLMPGDIKDDAARQGILDLYEADNFDWYRGQIANWNNFMRNRGIRTSGAEEYEYNESIIFPFKDTVRLFARNGIAIREYEPFTILFPDGTWDPKMQTAFLMDLNAPKWRATVKQGLLRPASFGDSVTQDNIGAIHGRFCQWNQLAFREYLQKRFTRRQIKKTFGDLLEYFDFRKYFDDLVRRKRQEKSSLHEDLICREWIRFQYLTNLAIWGEMARDIKREGFRMRGVVPAVWGNQCGDAFTGLTPFAVAQSRLVDVVWPEVRMYQPFLPVAHANAALVYKVGRAAGGYRKPVWAVQWPVDAPNSDRICEQIAMAEAAAQGGIAYTPIAWLDTPASNPRYLMTQKFLARWRALFIHREVYAKVALVYPMSSLYWMNSVMPGDYHKPDDFALNKYMGVMARVLEDLHILYEVVIFGHPDIWDDDATFQRLSRYKALVLPGLECLTIDQRKAVQSFAEGGGIVIGCGPLGTRDENFCPQEPLAVAGNWNWLTVAEKKAEDYFLARAKGRASAAVSELEKMVSGALEKALSVETSAPASVWMNAWLQEGGRRLSIHFVNYDVIVDDKALAKLKGNDPGRASEQALKEPGYAHLREARDIRVKIRPPSTVKFNRIRLLPLDEEPADLNWKEGDNGQIEFTLPRIRTWSIVVFTMDDELETSCEIARAKRSLDRIEVATRHRAPSSARKSIEIVEKIFAMLEFEKAKTQVKSAREVADKILNDTIAKLLAREAAEKEETLRLADHAVAALDFGEGEATTGWKKVGPKTMYGPDSSFGWLSDPSAKVLTNKELDLLHGTALAGIGEARLRIDVPNGIYEVTVVGGEAEVHGCFGRNWIGDGTGWRLLGEWLAPGKTSRRSFRTKVIDNHLLLRFYGTANNPDQGIWYVDAPDWMIAGIVLRSASGESIKLPDLEGGGLRDWLLIGPFDDAACAGLDRNYPAGVCAQLSFPPDREGRVAQRHCWKDEGTTGFAPVMLHSVMRPGNVFAYAYTNVCSPDEMEARLWFGSTGLAVVWLNGESVLCDEVVSGLQADEFAVPVKLRKGWNEILVRVCSWWGNRWIFSASLTKPSGEAIQDMQCRAVE